MLAIGAHPDDIEYGCSGLLLKLGPEASKAAFVASMGSAGDPTAGAARVQESRAAFEILGIKKAIFREQAGLRAEDFERVLTELYAFLEEVQPDLILTLGPHDTHQEHRYIHEITVAAARRSRASIFNYGILSNTLDFRPSVFVDISDVLNDKKAALAAHKSQSGKSYMSSEYLEIFHSHNYASLHGMRYCEAYEVVRAFL